MSEFVEAAPRVGIVGAGQLARMTIQAAISLGLAPRLLATDLQDSAAQISPAVRLGSPTSLDDLAAFAGECDVVTFDHELVDTAWLHVLEAKGHCFRPFADTVALAQNKRLQRERFCELGFHVPTYRVVREAGDLAAFGAEHGWPVVAKSVRGGYDGRGVWLLDGPARADQLAQQAEQAGLDLLVESWIPIERELAVLVARRPNGESVVYPVVETVQEDGICRELLAPAPISDDLARAAQRLALDIAQATGAVGVLALELFQLDDDLLINEIAARPHNSGHYSIEGCRTSQFENHLRAVLDYPLGSAELASPVVATANVIGGREGGDLRAGSLPAALAIDGVRVHLYGKVHRPGRKLGHVTALGEDQAEVRQRARQAAEILSGAASSVGRR